jgi:D-threo-aldose 1-dehydrogenase
LSERRLGEFLATKTRSDFTISTKVGRMLASNPAGVGQPDDEDFVVPAEWIRVWDFSSTGVHRTLEGSLERLGLDCVDVAYLHDPERWDLPAALGAGLPALADLRAAGLATAIGVASMSVDALQAAAVSGAVDVLMAAGRFTLADQSAAAEVLPACEERGIRVVAAAVFNGGLLASSPDESSTFDYGAVPREVLERARKIEAVCMTYGVSLRAAALRYPFRHPAVISVVVGGRTPEQIHANCEEAGRSIPTELWEHLRDDGLVAP